MPPRQVGLIGQQPHQLLHQLRRRTASAWTGLHQSARQTPRRPPALHPEPRPIPQLTRATRLAVRLAARVMLLGRSRLGASGVAGLENSAGPPRERLPHLQHASQVTACSSPCFAHALSCVLLMCTLGVQLIEAATAVRAMI